MLIPLCLHSCYSSPASFFFPMSCSEKLTTSEFNALRGLSTKARKDDSLYTSSADDDKSVKKVCWALFWRVYGHT